MCCGVMLLLLIIYIIHIYIYYIAVLIIICRFESTLLLKYTNPCRKIYIYIYICSDKFTFEYEASNIFQHFINKD